MGTLGLAQGFEPIGNFIKAFVPGGLGHARIHVGIFVGLSRDRCLEVVTSAADWQTGSRVAGFL